MTERRRPKTKPEPARRNHPRSVAELLPDVGGAAFRRFGFVQSAIVSRWAEIVGRRYAEASTPESIRFPPGRRAGGVLTLVTDGAHAPMMQHVAPAIVEHVNRFFGYAAIVRVSIRQGAVAAPARPPARRTPAPVPEELGESLRTVADPELREVLAALASAMAARQAEIAAVPVMGKVR